MSIIDVVLLLAAGAAIDRFAPWLVTAIWKKCVAGYNALMTKAQAPKE